MAPTMVDKLAALRARMAEHRLDAYIVPSEDAHQSEYIAACDARRAYISGFTGSAGLAVITATKAALWTDGRYFLQAGTQLDAKLWTLMKAGLPDTPSKEDWLVAELGATKTSGGGRVGIDAQLISIKAADTLRAALEAKGHHLVTPDQNLVDLVWGTDRPAVPCERVMVLDTKHSGKAFTDKLAELRKALFVDTEKTLANKTLGKPHGLLLTALDDLAWLFNLRGSDIQYNPVFFAYALINESECTLWIDERKLDDAVKTHLAKGNVTLRPYDAVAADLKSTYATRALEAVKLSDDATKAGGKPRTFLVDGRCSLAMFTALGGKATTTVLPRNPVVSAKAIKNATELEGFRQCHIRDAAALCTYLAWLEREVVHHHKHVSECDGADKLEQLRSTLPHYMGLSFDTISGSGPNGAVIHYKPERPTCRTITANEVYLVDSGAQYLDGTTDVTRTIHPSGTPSAFEKLAYTRVLQGHIALSRAVFPAGTTGLSLDVLARTPLWSSGLDFRHGTGHGVGHFLNVHEGPHSISPRPGSLDVALAAGMTVTNEPGYYHDGAFGIRIENVLLVVPVKLPHNFGDTTWLGFEEVTVVPLDKSLIDTALLNPVERDWINTYHAKCWDKVAPLLEDGSDAKTWLRKATLPL